MEIFRHEFKSFPRRHMGLLEGQQIFVRRIPYSEVTSDRNQRSSALWISPRRGSP